jgi:thiol-disulfide isomerase/thioredoxin
MQGLAPRPLFYNERVRRRTGVWVNCRSDVHASISAAQWLDAGGGANLLRGVTTGLRRGLRAWALVAIVGVSSRPAVAQSTDLEPGRLAPPFDLAGLDGGRVTLTEFRGRPVVINFWATWCTPCRVEMPMLIEAWQENRGQPLEIVAVNLTDQERGKDVRRFVEQLKLPFYVALDQRGRVRERYGLVSLPTTVFVDSAGTVRAVHAGPLSEHNLAEGLAAILPIPATAAPATGVDSTK